MKHYHVIIEKKHGYFEGEKGAEKMRETRREIICRGKIRCPDGWNIICVCGYHETRDKTGAAQ